VQLFVFVFQFLDFFLGWLGVFVLLNLLVNHDLRVLRLLLVLLSGLVHVESVGVLDRFAEVNPCRHCLGL
jgi:hypothetical protein